MARLSGPILLILLLAKATMANWPGRVLITNDDGVKETSLMELVTVFSEVSEEVVVVVPSEDCSSTSNYITSYRTHFLEVRESYLTEDVKMYVVEGTPGDCVLLALRGIMRDDPPDLVVSGINSGANLGFDWLASGTIAAARIAAYWGIPAIAASGYEEDIEGSAAAAARWIAELAQTETVMDLSEGRYLTLSFPPIHPDSIRGVRLAPRAGMLLEFSFAAMDYSFSPGSTKPWWMEEPVWLDQSGTSNDVVLIDSGYVVVVPMIADEVDYSILRSEEIAVECLPAW